MFERDGLLDARIADIAAEAGMATGSFYTYFKDKDDVFAAVMDAVRDEMFESHARGDHDGDTVRDVIEATNRAYLTSFKRNARLMALLNHAALIDPRYEKMLFDRESFVERNARFITRLQKEGHADQSLDAREASRALSAMTARLAFMTFVHGQRPRSFEVLVETVTSLWVNGLRIPDDV